MTDERVKEIIAEVSEWLTGEPLETGRVLLRAFEALSLLLRAGQQQKQFCP